METQKNFQEELNVYYRSIALEIDEVASSVGDAEMRPIVKHQITVEKKLYRLQRAHTTVLDSVRVEVEQAIYKLRNAVDQFVEKHRTTKGK